MKNEEIIPDTKKLRPRGWDSTHGGKKVRWQSSKSGDEVAAVTRVWRGRRVAVVARVWRGRGGGN